MRFSVRPAAFCLPLLAWVLSPGGAFAVSPQAHAGAAGPGLLRLLGPESTALFAPDSRAPSALVKLPAGADASTFGLDPVAPGMGRLRGSRDALLAFADAHPNLALEIAPPLHLLNDKVGTLIRAREAHAAGITGHGVLIGVADTGIDTTHPDFLDDAGHSRVRWILDFSQPPAGLHPDVEALFSVYVPETNQRFGAVYTGADLDELHAAGNPGSTDVVGHGSHVAGIAAGDGGNPDARTPYAGVAPDAGLMIVRLTRGSSQSIENDDLVRAVHFLFNRADAEKLPCVVNMSLGSDFGPHDGSSLWEQAIVQDVGPDKPGHVLVAAAGNSGAAAVLPIHQTVHVVKNTRALIPIDSGDEGGNVSIWINFRQATDMRVGLNGPDGEWIAPQPDGQAAGHNVSDDSMQYNAAVVHGSAATNSPIEKGSQAAVVGWQGNWPKGQYAIVLEGEGDAELYLQAVGATQGKQAVFLGGIREGTVNLPADHPSMLAVGATVNRPGWKSKGGQEIRVRAPTFDAAGDISLDQPTDLGEGDMAFFSSAGPNALGVPKPEIAAPGAVVASVISGQARPDSPLSIFAGARCPSDRQTGRVDIECMLVDDTHAVSSGTSMAAPVVAGGVALLLEREPTLTQGQAIALVQAGAHPHRGQAPYAAQSGPGELDVVGSLAALARMQDPRMALPSAAASWVSLGGDYWDAAGKTEMQALLELRNQNGEPADLFDMSRLTADVTVGDEPLVPQPSIERMAPGLYRYRALAPAGQGGVLAHFGARFDGQSIVNVKTVPVGLDGWRSRYPTTLGGGCSMHEVPASSSLVPLVTLGSLLVRRRRQR